MDTKTVKILKEISKSYGLIGRLKEVIHCVNGLINDTYHVKIADDKGVLDEYIFQRINDYVFKQPIKVMHNIKETGLHVKSKMVPGDCGIITFLDNEEGKNYTYKDGSYWRISPYIKNSIAFETAEDSKVLRSAGYAFGRFQHLLSDMPMNKLYETIPGFHNTRKRLDDFFDMVDLDPVGRVKEVEEEIQFFREHRELGSKLTNMLDADELPLRVTHNDTKYNNILMDKDTFEPLCVIDLDTVMPGLSIHDFGDAIRFAANTAVEDEVDLSKVSLNMENYEEFTNGFITASKELLTKNELENMALGAITITIELASRFLYDHINGDKYFRIMRENHNLDRARSQMRLAEDMMDKFDEMNRIVDKYYK